MSKRAAAAAEARDLRSPRDTCDACGAKYDDGEVENPYHDPEDHERRLCDNCYYEDHTFTCGICENYTEKDAQCCSAGSDVFLVPENSDATFDTRDGDEDDRRVPPGLYLVLRCPFHGGSLLGPDELFRYAVRRIGDLPDARNARSSLCHFVCSGCQRKHLGRVRRTPKPRKAASPLRLKAPSA
jgi:hypothetical protein